MATKTLACPECGSEAAPGRYACAECGALLNGVAVRPRASAPEPVASNGSRRRAKSGSASASGPAAIPVPLLELEPEPEPLALAVPSAIPGTFGSAARLDETLIDDPSLGWDPIRLDDEQEPAGESAEPAQTAPFLDVENDPGSGAGSDAQPRPEVAWPAPAHRGPLAAPEPRTPAGLYLPPS